MTTENSQTPDRLDEATAKRLAKLRTTPVETADLEARVEALIPKPTERPHRIPVTFRLRGAVRAIAACLVAGLLIGVVFWSLSGGAVMASPDTMARFHEELVSGTVHAQTVASIDEANEALRAQWEKGVQIPQVPSEHVMMCCMRSVEDKRVACVLLRSSEGGVPVTMAVAKALDMRVPSHGERVVRNRMEFHVQSTKGLQMVMTERDGRWICLIGGVPSDTLIDIATKIQF